MPLGGKEFGYTKSLWNGMGTFERISFAKCTNLSIHSFELGESTGRKSRAVKGWIQLSNTQKKALIECAVRMNLI